MALNFSYGHVTHKIFLAVIGLCTSELNLPLPKPLWF